MAGVASESCADGSDSHGGLLEAQPGHDMKPNPDLSVLNRRLPEAQPDHDIKANPDLSVLNRRLPEAQTGHDIKANPDLSVRNRRLPEAQPGYDIKAIPDLSVLNRRLPEAQPGHDIKANLDLSVRNPVGDNASASCTNAANNNPLKLKLGFAFVINHNTFEDSELVERSGSNFDVQKIEEVLKRFQISFHTVPNGALADVKRTKHRLVNFNFKDYASVILFIMSHGYENDMLAAKDGKYSLFRDVLFPMLRNKSLEGKTKLLFIQACKGSTNLVLSTDSKIEHPTRVPDKILQFSSCVEGYVSLRHSHGSIFIQTLCEKIEEFGDTEDIRDICNKVIDAVSWELAQMQIPMIHTNITKPFVFGHYSA